MTETQTTPEEDTGSHLEETVCSIVWVYPEERLTVLGRGTITLGRDPSCTVPLNDSNVTRVHATIQAQGTIRVLSDEGSRNGTRRNGVVINKAVLEPGDVVRIGEYVGIVARIPMRTGAAVFEEPLAGLLIGPGSRKSWEKLERAATTSLPVVLIGETGTGKEVYAKAVHERSGRGGRLVAVNCAALPSALVEAQLFGHVRGAFTGAEHAAAGFFVSADGGTLFLDEVLDLPLEQQAKLLRVIEDGIVTPVGGLVGRQVDVRLVAASQRRLQDSVDAGSFRADLMARLSGISIGLPPLRERREDIPRLFQRFLRDAGGQPSKLRASFVEALCLFAWPGNVRQLVQAARRTVALFGVSPELGASKFGELLELVPGRTGTPNEPNTTAVAASVTALAARELPDSRRIAWLRRREAELAKLLLGIEKHRGNVSAAARELGIPRFRAQRLLDAREELLRATDARGRSAKA